MKKGTKALYIILCVIFVGIFLFAGYKLLEGEIGYFVARRAYDSLEKRFVSANNKSKTDNITEEGIVLDPEISPIDVDFEELQLTCPDIAAWIYSPTITIMNYPVVRFDDNSWYLNHRYDGAYSSSGTIFIDCANLPDFKNDNTIIYGHHMNDGSMFAKLVNYKSQDFYDENPVMYINTPTYNYRLELFAGYVTKDDDDLTYKFDFNTEQESQKFIDYAKSKSNFVGKFDVQPGDKFCTLSTCTYEYDNARYVVHARMIPIH